VDDADHVMRMVVQTAPRGRLGAVARWKRLRGAGAGAGKWKEWNIFAALGSRIMYTGAKFIDNREEGA